jgi:hypothetical protein
MTRFNRLDAVLWGVVVGAVICVALEFWGIG